jgi:hypothetical protein
MNDMFNIIRSVFVRRYFMNINNIISDELNISSDNSQDNSINNRTVNSFFVFIQSENSNS